MPTTEDGEVIPPFPWKEMAVLLLVTSCDSIAFTQVFPYLGYFIIYLGMATDERTVRRLRSLRICWRGAGPPRGWGPVVAGW